MAVTIFAAIDVGSYEVSMDIYQISPKIGIEKIDEVRSRIELGHDTYTNGKISYESAQRLGEVLGDFSRIMKEYKVTSYRACATSTLQEAIQSRDSLDINQLRLRKQIFPRLFKKVPQL